MNCAFCKKDMSGLSKATRRRKFCNAKCNAGAQKVANSFARARLEADVPAGLSHVEERIFRQMRAASASEQVTIARLLEAIFSASRACSVCGSGFSPKHRLHRHCSPACTRESHRNLRIAIEDRVYSPQKRVLQRQSAKTAERLANEESTRIAAERRSRALEAEATEFLRLADGKTYTRDRFMELLGNLADFASDGRSTRGVETATEVENRIIEHIDSNGASA
jgi:hypothetical protein